MAFIEAKTSGLICRNIIYLFRIPYDLITDNGKQFDNEKYRKMSSKQGIKCYCSLLMHSQANGQVEVANKVIKHHQKIRLGSHEGVWVDELSSVLWAYRMILHSATRETPYSLGLKAEVVELVEIGLLNHRTTHFSQEGNNENLRAKLDMLEKK